MQREECTWNSHATTSKVNFKCVQSFSIPASLSLNFLFIYLIARIKDYISSGLHNKVIDPDGGIHSNKKQFENNGNDGTNKVVEWPKKSWTLSLDNAPEFQHCFVFSYPSAGRNNEEKKRGAFKSKQ